ncbi:alkaline phosphatase family protein [Pimelobacter sp. 30-1]|uniref:alkaline phosphatase family protein n=1 Tax=Pimelobacter sp. 30-1 TaxID=2004991 RepID=UPI001C044A0B|nr:alkaline phosphatase family protein [Pimelobacter sp. 30-1]
MTSLSRTRSALVLLATLSALVTGAATAPGHAVAPTPVGPAGTDLAPRAVNAKHVIAISVDGLNPRALNKLGRARTPYLHQLISEQGAGTLNARSQLEMTVTLPNHTSMVTGRRIKASRGGHGVTWNDDTVTKSVQQAAGHPVSSVFEVVHAGGGSTAVYATKSKFLLFERSWPAAVDKNVIKVEKNAAVVRALRQDLARKAPSFAFLHLGKPDQVGHDHGWLSPRYLDAVATVDRLIGTVLNQIRSTPSLKSSTVVVLTADHGGIPGATRHSDIHNRENYRVPFAVWGAGITRADLYQLNRTTRANPGRTRPGFGAARQPIRNGELANVSLSILGLGPVPGSLWDRAQDLRWR